MSVTAEAWVERHSPFTGATYIMHRAIGEVVDEKLEFYARLTEYAKKLRIERKTLGLAVQRLVAAGFLKVLESPFTPEGKPTGKPGTYRFVFVENLPVVYDGKKRTAANAPEAPPDGGESNDAPQPNDRSARESHGGISAGPRAESATDDRQDEPGESFDARHHDSPGESIDAPRGSNHARGESSLLTECNELDPTQSNGNFALVKKPTSAEVVPVDPLIATEGVVVASYAEDINVWLRTFGENVHVEQTDTWAVVKCTRADGTVQRRDLLWEATLATFGYKADEISDGERGRLNKAVSDLRSAGARPLDVARRFQAFRAMWPHITPTASALASRWAECNPDRVETLITAPTLDTNELAIERVARRRAEQAKGRPRR